MRTPYSLCVVGLMTLFGLEQVAAQELSHPIEFRVRLLQPLNTDTSKKDDPVSAQVIEPELYKDDTVQGKVIQSKSGGKIKGKSELSFTFLTLEHGKESIPISSSVKGMINQEGKTSVDDEGHVTRQSNNVGKAASAAGVGALIGAVVGGGKGAVIGGGAGAVASLVLIEVATQGPRVSLKTGSQLILSVKRRR